LEHYIRIRVQLWNRGDLEDMVRIDKSGKFVESGRFVVRYRFCSGKKAAKNSLSKYKYKKLVQIQILDPVKIMVDQEKKRNWWMFQDKFYLGDEGFDSQDIKAFAMEQNKKRP
jgi:hypothetical protein